jgi:hypothetical protein
VWIVKLALWQSLSVAVIAPLMLLIALPSFTKMIIDISPGLDLPVLMSICNYSGTVRGRMARRAVLITDY